MGQTEKAGTKLETLGLLRNKPSSVYVDTRCCRNFETGIRFQESITLTLYTKMRWGDGGDDDDDDENSFYFLLFSIIEHCHRNINSTSLLIIFREC